jgi:hypothetical protein
MWPDTKPTHTFSPFASRFASFIAMNGFGLGSASLTMFDLGVDSGISLREAY